MVFRILNATVLAAGVLAASAQQPAAHDRKTSVSHEVTMSADSYRPGDLIVAVGDTVVWRNTDIVAHTATSRGKGWDSGRVKSGQRFSWIAPDTGRFPYICSTHRGMKGVITVK